MGDQGLHIAEREASEPVEDAAGRDAAVRILASLYDDLRKMAQRTILEWRHGRRRSGTSLVNQVFVRLLKSRGLRLGSRRQLLTLFQQAMENELIDELRRLSAEKRPDARCRVPLTDAAAEAPSNRLDIAAVLEVLDELRVRDALAVKAFEYATLGAPLREVALLTGSSRRRASNRIAYVRAFVASRIGS